MSAVIVDGCVLLDVLLSDPTWSEWSEAAWRNRRTDPAWSSTP
jgi:hypothetical protein